MAVIASGQHARRQLDFDSVADALAEQGAAERRIHADVAGLAVELVRADDAVTPRPALPFRRS